MQEIFIRKLHAFIRENNLDVFVHLQMSGQLTTHLAEKVKSVDGLFHKMLAEGKPVYLIEEACMRELTRELRPSAFLYISAVVDDEFQDLQSQWTQSGVYEFEIINLIGECREVLEHYGFSEENVEDKPMKLAVIGTIQEYLEKQLVSVNL